MGISKLRAIVLDQIGVNSILLNPAASRIFHFKHNVEAFLIIIFIGLVISAVLLRWLRRFINVRVAIKNFDLRVLKESSKSSKSSVEYL